MTTLPVSLERRVGQRFDFNLPVSLRDQTTAAEGFGFTHDVSSRGAFFFTDIALNPGTEIEITLNMPSEITLGEAMRVRCKGRVLRVAKPVANGANREVRPQNVACLSGAERAELKPADVKPSEIRSSETQPSETKIGVAVCFNDYEYLAETEDASPDFRRISALHGPTPQSDRPAPPSSSPSQRSAAD
jgi:hypothetical protein